jgi:UDP-N-acetylglucosamine transferase subunit ALG13
MDEIAPKIDEKIIIQRGSSSYVPRNVESFTFKEDIEPYFAKARLVISHSATSLLEFVLKHKRPVITVPRQKKFHEHINDHQVEFAEFLEKSTGIRAILNIRELTPEFIKKYNRIARIDSSKLKNLQSYFIDTFAKIEREVGHGWPFAHNRIGYVLNLASPKKSDKVLNIGVSNIPEMEKILEREVKECWTLDNDEIKVAKARPLLKKTKFLVQDIMQPASDKKNYFDTIIMLEVLEHLKHDGAALEKIHAMLKRGGKLILSVPNMHPLHIINPVKYTQHERHYSNERLVKLLESKGFVVEHLNVVEDWRLLGNLFVHLFAKYVLRKNIQFNTFDKKGNKTYERMNRHGLDIIVRAVKA